MNNVSAIYYIIQCSDQNINRGTAYQLGDCKIGEEEGSDLKKEDTIVPEEKEEFEIMQ